MIKSNNEHVRDSIAAESGNATDLIPVNTARQTHFPGNPSPSTIWRWIVKGFEGEGGTKIRLNVTYVGRKPYLTADDISRFLAAVSKARLDRLRSRLMKLQDTPSIEELRSAGLAGRP